MAITVEGFGKDKNGQRQTLIHIGSSVDYLQSANYTPKSSGMHINLADGKIDAYNFTLTANGGNGSILIDSAGDIPLKIGNNFQVTWDGTMTSAGANINNANIQNPVRNINAISIAIFSTTKFAIGAPC